MYDRVSLAVFHQTRAAELYAFARWVQGKAISQSKRGFRDVLRYNQFELEADLAAKHAATARLLMGVE